MILNFPVRVNARIEYFVPSQPQQLGDRVIVIAIPAGRILQEKWQIEIIALSLSEKNYIQNLLLQSLGISSFQWRLREPRILSNYAIALTEDPYGDYFCKEWNVLELSNNCWQFNLEFNTVSNRTMRSPNLINSILEFPLNLCFSEDPKQDYSANLIKKQYDGGIIERIENGINAVADTFSFSANLLDEEKNTVNKFLKNNCGSSFFLNLLNLLMLKFIVVQLGIANIYQILIGRYLCI